MTIYTGNLTAQPGVRYDYIKITGWLYASGADTRTAFPKLTAIGGGLYASGADTRTAFPKLTTIGGTLYASGADTRAAFPKLTTIGGWLYARGADTRTAFPKLTAIGGTLDARGADTRTAFPKLTAIGGTLYASGADTRTAFPKLTSQTDHAAYVAALAKVGLVTHDGILSHVLKRRGPVTIVRRVGQTKPSYVITDGMSTAHGDTLREARADLRVKQGPRDTSAFKRWTRKTVVTQEDAIVAYRTITGACGAGVRQFLVQRTLPARLSIARVIAETAGQFGADTFAAFFRRAK